MGMDTAGLSATGPRDSMGDLGSGDDRQISLAGRSPVLDAAQLGVLHEYGSERDLDAGDVLFADGDETYDLIVLLTCRADIIKGYGQSGASVVASFGPSEFLGEVGMLTGQRAFLSAVTTSAGRVLVVPVAQVRKVMAQEPGLSDLILRTLLLRRSVLMSRGTGLTLIGSRFDPDTRRLLGVLARNRLVWNWLDLEASPEVEQILQGLNVPVADLPIIIVPGRPVLRNPRSRAVLDALGISGDAGSYPPSVCDLLVVGAGPAGLAASVYGASDGMATTLAEDTALGGQAGTSSRIENYLGFPAGLSGEELATRGALQAQKFGVRMKLAARAASLSVQNGVHRVTFDDGEAIQARSVIIATGAQYNRLPLDRLAEFEGRRRLLRRDTGGGPGLPERAGCNSRWRQLCGAGRSFPQPLVHQSAPDHPPRCARRLNVAVPRRPDRAQPWHRHLALHPRNVADRDRQARSRPARPRRPAGNLRGSRNRVVRLYRGETGNPVAGGPAG
jgi:thioredoxin reductase (NADPH)